MRNDIQNSFRKILSSRITKKEAQANPEINQALENDKIMRLDFLSSVKPTLIDTKGFKNGKRKNMIEEMNTFKKIYFHICRNLGPHPYICKGDFKIHFLKSNREINFDKYSIKII